MSPRKTRAVLSLGVALGAAWLSFCVLVVADRELRVSWGGEPLVLLDPRGLSALALLPLVALTPAASLTRLSRLRLTIALAARSLAMTLVALALSRPVSREQVARVSAVIAVDVSDSMSDAALDKARTFVKAAQAQRGEENLKLVTFGGSAQVQPLSDGEDVPISRNETGSDSDLAQGLSTALSLLPADRIRKVVLISDGRETRGDLERAAARLHEQDTELDWVDPGDAAPRDVAISRVTLPSEIKAGEPFRVGVTVQATQLGKARLTLRRVGETQLETRDLTLERGTNEVEVRAIAYVPGPITYEAILTPEGEDRFPQNNRFQESAIVTGKPQVLYVEGQTERARPFAELLRASGFDVDIRGPAGTPTREADLALFDFYVLSNVPSDALPSGSVEAIATFMERGGGFMMAGGDESFGLGGYRSTKMETLLPVRLDTERRRDQPSLALVLVIDKSGSMSGQKIDLAKEAARATADLLGEDDYLGVIGFDAQPTRVVRLQTANNRMGLAKGIGRLMAGGGTAIFPALDAAYQDLSAVRARLKHVILLTDGQTQEEGIPVLVQSMQVDGITVSAIGLGGDVNRGLLEELSRLGGGRSYFTSDASNIPRLFVKETNAVARSAAVEDYVAAHVVAPADFLRGLPIDAAPYLRGYVATRARPAPAQVILQSDLGEPLLARMRVGLGWSLAWTSDLTPRWSAEWLRWRSAPAFFAQLVREHMRAREDASLRIQSELQGDTMIGTVDALDPDERFLHGLSGELTVSRARSETPAKTAPLREVAPGRYAAELPLTEVGSYVLSARLSDGDKTVLRATGKLSHPFPAEYATTGVARDRLAAAARTTGGRELTQAAQVFDPGSRRVQSQTERWPGFLWAALLFYVLDLAARRARWPTLRIARDSLSTSARQ